MPFESKDLLRNYRQLTGKVDDLCRSIGNRFFAEITCHRGCDSCCRHLTLFPVEGAVLARAVAELPAEDSALLRQRASLASADGPCPLLLDGVCLLYSSRPLICRTHGFPLLLTTGRDRQVDFCPRNFCGIHTIPPAAVIDLDRLNNALAGVNALFLQETQSWRSAECQRLLLSECLLLDAPEFLFPFEK